MMRLCRARSNGGIRLMMASWPLIAAARSRCGKEGEIEMVRIEAGKGEVEGVAELRVRAVRMKWGSMERSARRRGPKLPVAPSTRMFLI